LNGRKRSHSTLDKVDQWQKRTAKRTWPDPGEHVEGPPIVQNGRAAALVQRFAVLAVTGRPYQTVEVHHAPPLGGVGPVQVQVISLPAVAVAVRREQIADVPRFFGLDPGEFARNPIADLPSEGAGKRIRPPVFVRYPTSESKIY